MQIKIGKNKDEGNREQSPVIKQRDYGEATVNYFNGVDINIFKEFLPQFDSQKKEARIVQIEGWRSERRINDQTKEQFISLVEILDQSDKAKDEEIAKLKQQGNIVEADILQHLKDSFGELKLEALNKVKDQELEKIQEQNRVLKAQSIANDLLMAKIYTDVAAKAYSIYEFAEAAENYEKAIYFHRRAGDTDSVEYAYNLDNLGYLSYLSGKSTLGEELSNEANAIILSKTHGNPFVSLKEK